MTAEEIRETVANRVPYYGECMIQNDDGEWVRNEEYIERGPVEEPLAADDD